MTVSSGESAGVGDAPVDVAAIAQAIGLAVIAVIPAFLIGALAVGIRAELGFGPSVLGLVIAWFFVTSAVSATMLGQVVERLGVPTSLMVGSSISGVTLIGVSIVPSVPWLLLAMTAGGTANAISQPAVNASLSQRIPGGRLGLAMGIKQSAIPSATLIGGLAVPTIGAWFGWRVTFVIAGAFAFAGAFMARRVARRGIFVVTRRRRRVRDLAELRSLAIISVAGVLGAAATASLGSFFVDAAVDTGISESGAGYVFALASALGITTRILVGQQADARPRGSPYGRIALLLGVGTPGYLLLAVGAPAPYVVGGVLAYAAGWAWPGLYHYAAVSQNPTMPAAATGVIQTGVSMGAGLGPLVLGWLAEAGSYRMAWIAASVLSASAAAVTLIGRAHLRRARRRAPAIYLDEITSLELDAPEEIAPGVGSQRHVTAHLDVTLYRIAPQAAFDVPAAGRSGAVVVLEGGQARVRTASAGSVADVGEYLSLPAHRSLYLRNDGTGTLIVAHATAHGRVDAVTAVT